MASWRELPDSLLLKVFFLLDRATLVDSAALVCRSWNRVSKDNLLWRSFFVRDFKLRPPYTNAILPPRPDAPGAEADWLSEYRRLVTSVPCVESQTLTAHCDEVLHVAFSHDGKQVVSCSKDHQVIVWNCSDEGTLSQHYVQDMNAAPFNWMHTWAAQFSPRDTKLMVSGVVSDVGGEVVIFSTGRAEDGDGNGGEYKFLCRLINDPYDVLGCWCSDDYFFSGSMVPDFDFQLESSIWMCRAGAEAEAEDPADAPFDANHDVPQSQMLISTECYAALLFRFTSNGSIYVRYIQSQSRKAFGDDAVRWSKPELAELLDQPEQLEVGEECESEIRDGGHCLVFLCGDRASVPHQVGFQRITPALLKHPICLRKPERVIEFDGHVIGLSLSPDGAELFVNVRSWPTDAVPTMDQTPSIASQIEMHVIDMATLERKSGKIFVGHRGFTPSEKAFYLYLDVSDDFVGSGSEDHKGYLWERHYGALLAKLPHDACVNCVAMRPGDQELCVTASDDNKIKVWRSRRSVSGEAA